MTLCSLIQRLFEDDLILRLHHTIDLQICKMGEENDGKLVQEMSM